MHGSVFCLSIHFCYCRCMDQQMQSFEEAWHAVENKSAIFQLFFKRIFLQIV